MGSKMGLDATNKWPGETQREWARTISMDAEVQQRMVETAAHLAAGVANRVFPVD